MIALIVASTVVIFDQASKWLMSQFLSLGQSVPLIKNIFHLSLVHNTGIAFGMFKNQTLVFIVISICAIILIAATLITQRKTRTLHRVEVFALSLILGGAFGNLIDRFRFGYVIDFLDFRIWPVFNLADSAITIGVTLLLIRCIPSFSK